MVSIFKKTESTKRDEATDGAARRAARLPTHDLIEWAHVLLNEGGRNLSDWQRGTSMDSFAEFKLSMDALNAVKNELEKRGYE